MIPTGPHRNQLLIKPPRNMQKTCGNQWARRGPESPKSTSIIRPLLAANQNNTRPLASGHQNKQLSATTSERSMKLRKPKNDKLRKSNTGAAALSKKVNKVISASKQVQSKTGPPRAQSSKVLKTKISSEIVKENQNSRLNVILISALHLTQKINTGHTDNLFPRTKKIFFVPHISKGY